MIYGESAAGLTKLTEGLKKIGLYEVNAEIMSEYLDMSKERDDSLLERVQLTTIYGKNFTDMSKYDKAVVSEIVKEKNEELTSRFVCFLWAAYGASCCELIGKLTVRPTGEDLGELLKKNLTPWLGEEQAAMCAYASMCIYSTIRIYNYSYVTKDRTPEEMAAAADMIMPVNEWVGMWVYALALENSPLPENGGEPSETIERICRVLEEHTPKPNTKTDIDTYELALGEGALFSPELREKLRNKIAGKAGNLAYFAVNHRCRRVLDVLDDEPTLCDEKYIRYLPEIKDECRYPHMERMAKEHTELFTKVMMDHTVISAAREMSEVMQRLGLPCPDVTESIRSRALEIVRNTHRDNVQTLVDYVSGKLPLDKALDDMIDSKGASGRHDQFDYYGTIGADDLFAKYFTVMMLTNMGYSKQWFVERTTGLDYVKNEKEAVGLMFGTGLPAHALLTGVADYVDNLYSNKELCIANTAAALAEYPDKLDELEAGDMSAVARQIAVMAFGKNADRFKDKLMAMAEDGSKAVRSELAKIMGEHKDWSGEISELLLAKKAAKRELAIAAIERQGGEGYREVLEKAFQGEKSAKIKDRIALLIGAAVSSAEEGAVSAADFDMVEELTKGGKARKVAWAFEGSVKPVRNSDGSEAEQKYLEAILLCYANMTNYGVSATANTLAEKLDPRDLKVFAAEVFGKWLDLGAQAKTKWALYFSAIHGGEGIINDFMHYIKSWGENSRGAIAAEAVRAMALSGSTTALMNVDGISRKFKNKMVRGAATDALRNAAEELGLTTQELADKIVPDLGFDENMCRVFDYGSRQFKVYLGAGSELEIYNGDKRVKSLPKAGANDDPEKAAQAAADFKEMKKQLKTVAANQKSRLEYALMNDRKWSVEGWRSLFVKNAVMHGFAIGLIWGLYGEDGSLIRTFRYTEEGSFNTSDDEELELPETGNIGLVHPLELTAEQIDEWKAQLEDYEISQPFPQLTRKVYTMTDDERKSAEILRFDGVELNSLSLIGKLTKLGWYKGQAEDGGWFGYFYREDVSGRRKLPDGAYVTEGVLACLEFSGASIVAYDFEGEDVTVGKLELYRPGANIYRAEPMQLSKVSDRYFSELVMQLCSVLGTNGEDEE